MPAERSLPYVCPFCTAHTLDSGAECENCATYRTVLGCAPSPVTPVSLYHRDTPLREVVTGYKPDFGGTHEPAGIGQVEASIVMRDIVATFFQANPWLTDDTEVVVVPSTSRPAPHPLEVLLSGVDLGAPVILGALKRTEEPLEHRTLNPGAYNGTGSLTGCKVVLLDDVYASGARLQSAAVALRTAGARVQASVVVARRVNPDYREPIRQMWEEQQRVTWSWERPPSPLVLA